MPLSTPRTLFAPLPQRRTLRWIGLRPARRQVMQVVDEAMLPEATYCNGNR